MLFCAVSKDYLCIYYSAEFDSFQSSGSQPLFRKLGLWDKRNLPLLKVPNHVSSLDYCASMHELAVGIPLFPFEVKPITFFIIETKNGKSLSPRICLS